MYIQVFVLNGMCLFFKITSAHSESKTLYATMLRKKETVLLTLSYTVNIPNEIYESRHHMITNSLIIVTNDMYTVNLEIEQFYCKANNIHTCESLFHITEKNICNKTLSYHKYKCKLNQY